MSTEPQSPYVFEHRAGEVPERSKVGSIRTQCLIVCFLFALDVVTIWLQPHFVQLMRDISDVQNGVNNLQRTTFEDRKAISKEVDRIIAVAQYSYVFATSLFAARMLMIIPFCVSVVLSTEKRNFTFRAAALLGTSVPLAIGLYRNELKAVSEILYLISVAVYQFLVVALTYGTLVMNRVKGSGRSCAVLSFLQVCFLLSNLWQQKVSSVAAMYIPAVVAIGVFLFCIAPYCMSCFRFRQKADLQYLETR
ncbi:MAG TPA: hypothetical protein PLY87_22055 [Planctomycetaceae bacterium]|nr:hypothetical protein [Planctomycetaceae bacterium]